MTGMTRIVECVPNFSEGRDREKIEKIVEPFRGREGVKLLDCQRDEDHNRCVVTVVGEPEPLQVAVLAAMGAAWASARPSTAASGWCWTAASGWTT